MILTINIFCLTSYIDVTKLFHCFVNILRKNSEMDDLKVDLHTNQGQHLNTMQVCLGCTRIV